MSLVKFIIIIAFIAAIAAAYDPIITTMVMSDPYKDCVNTITRSIQLYRHYGNNTIYYIGTTIFDEIKCPDGSVHSFTYYNTVTKYNDR